LGFVFLIIPDISNLFFYLLDAIILNCIHLRNQTLREIFRLFDSLNKLFDTIDLCWILKDLSFDVFILSIIFLNIIYLILEVCHRIFHHLMISWALNLLLLAIIYAEIILNHLQIQYLQVVQPSLFRCTAKNVIRTKFISFWFLINEIFGFFKLRFGLENESFECVNVGLGVGLAVHYIYQLFNRLLILVVGFYLYSGIVGHLVVKHIVVLGFRFLILNFRNIILISYYILVLLILLMLK
jgi:hypothetical protein